MSKYVFNLTGPEMEAALNKATKVVANPEITGSEAALESIEIADTKYKLGGTSAVWGQITGDLNDQTDLQSSLSAKQETLVSGTNIKTINNESILGSGNIEIQGGGGLPTPANAGDAMVYNGTEWAKQANYGYTAPATGADLTWDGDITGKELGTFKYMSAEPLYKINDTPFVYADLKDDDVIVVSRGESSEEIPLSEVFLRATNTDADFLGFDDGYVLNVKNAGSGSFIFSDYMMQLSYQNAEVGIYVLKVDEYYISKITCNHIEVATWDGDTTGKHISLLSYAKCTLIYKVNDAINAESFRGLSSVTLVLDGEPSESPASELTLYTYTGADLFAIEGTPVVVNAVQPGVYSFWFSGYNYSINIDEVGLYALASNDYYNFKACKLNAVAAIYVSNITLADSSIVPNPAWDGEVSGRTTATIVRSEEKHIYKVSERYNYAFADFKNCSSLKIGGSTRNPQEDYFKEFENCFTYFDWGYTLRIVCAKQAGTYTVVNTIDVSYEVTVPSAGMYFYTDEQTDYVSEFKFGVPEHLVKIDESYIPQNPKVENAIENKGFGTVDFATTVSTIYNNGGSGSVVLTNIETSQTHIIYKGSELHPSKYAKSFIGQDMWLYNGIGLVNITADTIFTDNNALAIIYNNSIRVFEIQKATTSAAPGYITIDGINYSYVGEPGTYFYSTASVNYLAPIYNKIDENLVPSVGGSGAGTFIAEYGTTTYADISAAIDEGKSVYCKFIDASNNTLLLTYSCKKAYDNTIIFTQTALNNEASNLKNDSTNAAYTCAASVTSNNTWSEDSAAIQQKLVSGTDIKTINNQSVLGSGNLDIAGGVTSVNGKTGDVTLNASDVSAQETLVSGTNIKTINSASILGSGNLEVSTDYTTTVPTADNPTGLKFVVLDSEPEAKYSGWFYIITD